MHLMLPGGTQRPIAGTAQQRRYELSPYADFWAFFLKNFLQFGNLHILLGDYARQDIKQPAARPKRAYNRQEKEPA